MQGLFIITGEQGSGKTSLLKALSTSLAQRGKTCGGILAHGKWDDNLRSGFDLEFIPDGKTVTLCESAPREGWIRFRRFWFNPLAFDLGKLWLTESIVKKPEVLMLDEIGPAEMENGGWAAILPGLFAEARHRLVIVTVRARLSEAVVERWNLSPAGIFEAGTAISTVMDTITATEKEA
ncbi:nucleoside-triphosphatase THEP1 [Lentimicrobium saccharophilum]|uniref:Nucleoside-triphosphatase THEP1 n=1 Tax=Lentimicrobium saccharophilum TaxID=1678841 RepID=A0A0S7BS59_9BACT|nr:nucleoside-triphosphatase [Lentimicrobium saccharophilum]GAP43610.1 nucleoside-triphosphatase THEP1 [Lentimicrobium saccharophilum]